MGWTRRCASIALASAALAIAGNGCGSDSSSSSGPATDGGQPYDASNPIIDAASGVDASPMRDVAVPDVATNDAAESGTTCTSTGPTWSFVDGDQTRGLVFAPAPALAYTPELAVFNSKLYATWYEDTDDGTGNFTVSRVHVAVYGGNDANPSWSFVDNGIAGTKTQAPHIAAVGNKLYIAYVDIQGTTSIAHVAVYNGDDSAPSWTNVDGTTLPNGVSPWIDSFGGKLYAIVAIPIGGGYFLRVVVYNGNDAMPSWQVVDGGGASGLDSGLGQRTVTLNNKLYALWLYNNSGEYLLKSSVYNGDDSAPAWTNVSGSGGSINQDIFNFGGVGSAGVANGKLYAMWVKTQQGTNNVAYQVSVYGGNDASPTWTAVDEGGLVGRSTRPASGTGLHSLQALGTTLYAMWVQNGSIEVAEYNGNDAAPVWANDIGCRTELNHSSQSYAAAYTPGLVSFNGKLYGAWSEGDSAIGQQTYSIRVVVRTP
jgi:hypothetical protein